MFYPRELLDWVEKVSSHLRHLSKSQAQVLSWYSLAVTLVQSSGLSQVSYFLAQWLGQKENTVRQRLRESLYDATDKRGRGRRELEVEACFAPLLKWVLSVWHSQEGMLFLALDATTLRETFTVLSVSVLLGRWAIPVAWAVLPANRAGAWKGHWQRLLKALSTECVGLQVLVLADRGLYADWLFIAIQKCGWHPLLRINTQGNVCVHESGQRLTLAQLAQRCRGYYWHASVTCFPGRRALRCTLLVLHDLAQQEPWVLLTDLPTSWVSPAWYALRMWIELGFKVLNSAGFHWHNTRLSDPARASRLWLVLALACLRRDLLAPLQPAHASTVSSYPRLSTFKQALLSQLAALLRQLPLLWQPLHFHHLPPPPSLEFAPSVFTYP